MNFFLLLWYTNFYAVLTRSNLFFFCFLQTADASQPQAVRMAGSPALENEERMDIPNEPLFSTLDIVLLSTLLLAALWWLMRRNKQEEYTPVTKSYSIQ